MAMKSRAANILVPLVLELTFALGVFIAIRATDGGLYGLGARAATEHLEARYWSGPAYEATVTDLDGRWGNGALSGRTTRWLNGRMQFFFKRPQQYAALAQGEGGEWFWSQAAGQGTLVVPDEAGAAHDVQLGVPPFDAGLPWPPPFVYELLRYTDLDAEHPLADVTHIQLVSRRDPDGVRCDVLVLWRKRPWRELWLEPNTGELRACVFLDSEEPHTELYALGEPMRPVDPAVFAAGVDGLKELKRCLEQRTRELSE